MRYRIINITHSGRKGLRGTPVEDFRHHGLLNCIVEFNFDSIEDLKQFECVPMTVYGNIACELWYTSEVIQITRTDRGYIMETVNTIYELMEVL